MDFLHMLNFILRNNFQLDSFSKVMPFVYFNKKLIKDKLILQFRFSRDTATFHNIGDFLKRETPLAVSRTVSQRRSSPRVRACSVRKARKSPSAIFPEKPRTETVRLWRDKSQLGTRTGPGPGSRGERHKRVSSDSGKLRHNHRVVTS